ncbi:GtrA family protein [Niallia oryzisoli]|uniref:GtrA family protein n=1 Tax=Niallia oryzisoli TaxID=1737571 RepID=A0ABZ2CEY7_9BACI
MVINKELSFKFMKYSFVGCISTLIYFISVFVLVEWFIYDPLYASALSFIFMTLISYLLNRKFTFGSTLSTKTLLRFLVVSLIGFIINFIIMYLIVKVFDLHYYLGELVTTLIIPVINFILNNYWTFRIKNEGGSITSVDTGASTQNGT